MSIKQIILIGGATCVLYSCIGSRTTTNNYTLKETSREAEAHKTKKVLIVGHGGTGTRFFMENLSDVLKQKLLVNQVEAEFEFLGFKEQVEKKLMDILSREGHDAVLHFKPTGDELNPIVVDDYNASPRGASINMQTTAVRFTQDFVVSFYAKESNKAVWTATLSTNLDSRNEKFYNRIADDILRYLQKDFL
ncbi:MAG: hypothetical protein JWR72_4234 [Flavisolibacter sp.]|nr:hypothetical protein [Flavisolibacter sp.]